MTELIAPLIEWSIALNQFLGFMKKVLFAGRITPYKNGWINKDCFDCKDIHTKCWWGQPFFINY